MSCAAEIEKGKQGKQQMMSAGSMGLWWKTAKTSAAFLSQEKGTQEKGKLEARKSEWN